MVAQVTITGTDLRRLQELLREAPPEIRRGVTSRLRVPARKIAAEQRQTVRTLDGAPSEWKADAARNIRVDLFLTGRRQGIWVRMRRNSSGTSRGGWLLNQGVWQHPTFGRYPRRTQRVRAGWFDAVAARNRPGAIREAAVALEQETRALAARIDRLN